MNDGVEQEAFRVYENVALLTVDFLARVETMRINGGPPCMGIYLSSSKRSMLRSFYFLQPVDEPRHGV
jgi:hypothetical protein